MTKRLCYYSHRFGGDPANLARAKARFAELEALWKTERPDLVLWAPWLKVAEVLRYGVDDPWHSIEEDIRLSLALVLDHDGEPRSAGMARELLFFCYVRAQPEYYCIDGDITPASAKVKP